MNRRQVKHLERKMIDACDANVANGLQVVSLAFNQADGACPMVHVSGLRWRSVREVMLACTDQFRMTEEEFWEFIKEFDGPCFRQKRSPFWKRWSPLSRMARRLRKRYIPKVISEL